MTNVASSYTVVYTTPIANNPLASFTRPNDTTAYASGDIVANSTAAGSVVPMSFTVGRFTGSGIFISRVQIAKSGTSTTNAAFRLHLFKDLPTVTSGDNAALAMGGLANYIGQVDVTVSQALNDGTKGFSDNTLRTIHTFPTTGGIIYGLLEARGIYTPVANEVFTVTLECTLE